jgi:hypothetical protein
MHFGKLGNLMDPRNAGGEGNPRGLLNVESILKNAAATECARRSENPILRGIPATSSRTSPPLVVTMGTTGV